MTAKGSTTLHPREAQSTEDGKRLIKLFAGLVEPLGRSLPGGVELVLHDLSRREHSIVAIYGAVTGRRVGDSSIDLLVERIVEPEEGRREFECRLPDGRSVRCSAMPIADKDGNHVASLVVNTDLAVWDAVRQIVQPFLAASVLPRSAGSVAATELSSQSRLGPGTDPAAVIGGGEEISRDLIELADAMIRREIAATGIPVELMKKRHKIEVVRALRARGVFGLRDAVESVAEALKVSRFTIYNYINEMDSADE